MPDHERAGTMLFEVHTIVQYLAHCYFTEGMSHHGSVGIIVCVYYSVTSGTLLFYGRHA